MNAYANGYSQYKEQSVHTMTPGEMLLLLFDELMKRLVRSELSLQKADYTAFDTDIVRAREIVQYLSKTLDHQYPISRELQRMYDFFIYELGRIQAGRSAELIQGLKPLVNDLRSAFREADKKAKAAPAGVSGA